MTGLLVSVLVGGGLGALFGRFGKCTTGGCPLTATWQRGALYGAGLGLVFHFAVGGSLGRYQHPKNIPTVGEANFDAEVIKAGRPVVVDFFAPWCGPCKMLAPELDKLAGEFGDRIKFVSVNVDDSPALAAKFKVEGIPTLLLLGRDGAVVETTVGLLSPEVLRAKLEALAERPGGASGG